MNTAPDRWSSIVAFFSDTVVQAIVGVVVVSVLSAIAYFVLAKCRDSNTDNQQLDDLLRKNFEEMRSEGDIDEQEFRKIKALLSGSKSMPLENPTRPPASPSDGTPKIDADSADSV